MNLLNHFGGIDAKTFLCVFSIQLTMVMNARRRGGRSGRFVLMEVSLIALLCHTNHQRSSSREDRLADVSMEKKKETKQLSAKVASNHRRPAVPCCCCVEGKENLSGQKKS